MSVWSAWCSTGKLDVQSLDSVFFRTRRHSVVLSVPSRALRTQQTPRETEERLFGIALLGYKGTDFIDALSQ